jgi:hypothetical protein
VRRGITDENGEARYVSNERLGGVGIVFVKDTDSECASPSRTLAVLYEHYL